MSQSPTAAVIVIGNEVLSGKVKDANTPYFIERLRGLGIRLSRVVMIEDGVDIIAEAVRDAAARFDYVFTSGGLGPTHDDLTMAGVARAFDCALVQSAALVEKLDDIRGKRTRDALMRLTWIPAKGELFQTAEMRWPIVHVDNVYIFPGVPGFLRKKFEQLAPTLEARPFVSGVVDCNQSESELVDAIDGTDAAFTDVEIGSYPQYGDVDHKTHLTFDHLEVARVNAAIDHFLEVVDPGFVVRVVRPPQ